MRCLIVGLLCCVPAFAQQSAPLPASQPPLFRSHSSELVVLPVTVTDRTGRLVTDLSRERFNVYDEGRLQSISAFTSEDIPVSIALVIDDSGSMGQKLGQVIAASLAFARWSHPEDELLIIEFNEQVRDALVDVVNVEGRDLHPRPGRTCAPSWLAPGEIRLML